MTPQERNQLIGLLDQSYEQWTGQSLPVPSERAKQRLEWLDQHSPYGLLIQNTEPDPLFIYANQQAQLIFGYSLAEFLATPASQSAPPERQQERNLMLAEVANKGISNNYRGTRIRKDGQLFEIEGSIWKVLGKSGEMLGIAAMIWSKEVSS